MDTFNKKEEAIFNLGIDDVTRAYMLETARWGKFLAILSFIALGLIFMALFFSLFFISAFEQVLPGFGASVLFVYFVLVAIYIYPVLALYKFSTLSRQALHSYNQQQFNESQRHLRNIFKFMGIVAIVILALYGIMIIFAVIGAAVGSM